MSGELPLSDDPADQLAAAAETAAASLFARFGRDAVHVAVQNRQRARLAGHWAEASAWRSIQNSIAELIEREADRAFRDRLPARTALGDIVRRLAPSEPEDGAPGAMDRPRNRAS